jgi:hypothetical protein
LALQAGHAGWHGLKNEQLGALLWNVRHLSAQHVSSVLGNVHAWRRIALNMFNLALHLQQCIAWWEKLLSGLGAVLVGLTPLLDPTGKFVAACLGWVVLLKSIINVMLSMITTTRKQTGASFLSERPSEQLRVVPSCTASCVCHL